MTLGLRHFPDKYFIYLKKKVYHFVKTFNHLEIVAVKLKNAHTIAVRQSQTQLVFSRLVSDSSKII